MSEESSTLTEELEKLSQWITRRLRTGEGNPETTLAILSRKVREAKARVRKRVDKPPHDASKE